MSTYTASSARSKNEQPRSILETLTPEKIETIRLAITVGSLGLKLLPGIGQLASVAAPCAGAAVIGASTVTGALKGSRIGFAAGGPVGAVVGTVLGATLRKH